jgi:hypothetical protein
MRKQVTHLSPHQSAKVVAVLYVVCTLPFALFGVLGLIFGWSTTARFHSAIFIFVPLIYGVIGYILFALFCWVYNHVAQRIGGIEFSVEELPDA